MCVRDDHLSRHTEPHLSLLTAFPIQTDIAGGLQHDNLPFYISEASITLGPSILFHGIFGRVLSSRWYGAHMEITGASE